MPSWVCKIWRFVSNLLGKIVDFVLDVVKKVVQMVVEGIDSLAESIFGSGTFWLLLVGGILAYFLLTKDDDKPQIAAYSLPGDVNV